MKGKLKSSNLIVHIILIIGAIAMLIPFIWMILTSLKTLTESTSLPVTIMPKSFKWGNYVDVWNQLPFAKFYINTMLMIFFRVIGSVFFSAMAAYALARIEFPGKNFFFMLILIQMMIPGQIFIIPQYAIISKLGLLNTVTALVIPGIISAFGTFLLRQFFIGIPKELEEAAILDGCNRWQVFWKVMLPLTRSGLVALGIFTSVFAYKDLMWPLIVNMSLDKMPLAAGMASLQGQYSTNFPQLMSGSMIAIWPMLIIFIIFQKQFIEGVASTGSKS
ncbi:carbohydrate ABC transporter permease [Clostridium estertheticum]|uniref:Carbohydrate ABC transporter permease n=1 Tax=Clostridium estertheticum TaxID=238834 RepID=A0A7Y3WTR7_9CLOT|nr:carbohydrate ABC transporter permease [Clostridium estertheticum]MBW9171939.1 carbohydrate ABC transporter permease [Clostridium estertheticum]MBX4260098.1 carbohydrate ABC transporter permease [Clostridium estertheticum]NNU77250.1 carbohydrate ABC transporter permease [Clostridium estertheticum]WBL45687.1 carbohydrate ABC transporter permease [Clostridium estertheticum]WLC72110.1 carbohydrate ABC transporter permease [Clostridium estertheticum]